jgi:hypothetical protein
MRFREGFPALGDLEIQARNSEAASVTPYPPAGFVAID